MSLIQTPINIFSIESYTTNLKLCFSVRLGSTQATLNGGNSDLFNCGYGEGYSVKQVIQNLNDVIKKKIKVKIGPRRPGDSKMIVSQVDKFKNKFSWQPKYEDLSIILNSAVNWEKKI